MPFKYETIKCQNPTNTHFIDRDFVVVRYEFNNKHKKAPLFYEKAWNLVQKVNPHKANDATNIREKERLMLDAFGGILAENGWYYYINRTFGENTVQFTEFNSATAQIDLRLSNGKTIEVRSSFPRNGVKFAICSERYNFKNICKYDNLYKPSEIDKDFFASVLFETQKNDLFSSEIIVFYLIGGSTKEMMMNDNLSFVTDLVAEDDLTKEKTRYKVIYLKDALDISGFEEYMNTMGYIQNRNVV